MRGRKPTPVEQKIAEGNPGHRPLPDPVSVAGKALPVELVKPPAVLGADGKAWWTENVPLMAESGILDRIDRSNLVMAAMAWDDWSKARRVLTVDGFFATGSVGQIRPHPAIKIAQDAEARFRTWSEVFGWNPMSRTRLGLQQMQAAAMFREFEQSLNGDGGDFIEGTEAPRGDVGLPGA